MKRDRNTEFDLIVILLIKSAVCTVKILYVCLFITFVNNWIEVALFYLC